MRPAHHIATLARLASLSLALLAMTATAADTPPIKPGLWEMTQHGQKMNGQAMPDASAQMAAAMKDMPPEMRKRMEAQMKAHGVQMSPSAGGGMATRMCLTREMLDQNRWQRTDGHCSSQVVSRSGNTWKWKVNCTQPPADGEGTTTFTGQEGYQTEMRMNMVQDGRRQTMEMKHSARWLGADCGALKPVAPPTGSTRK